MGTDQAMKQQKFSTTDKIQYMAFDSVQAFYYILNVLLKYNDLFNSTQCISIYHKCSNEEYQSNMLALCWHNIPIYYAY